MAIQSYKYKTTSSYNPVINKYPNNRIVITSTVKPKKKVKKKQLFDRWYWPFARGFIIAFVLNFFFSNPFTLGSAVLFFILAVLLNILSVLLEQRVITLTPGARDSINTLIQYLKGKFKKKTKKNNNIHDLFFSNIDEFKEHHKDIDRNLDIHKNIINSSEE